MNSVIEEFPLLNGCAQRGKLLNIRDIGSCKVVERKERLIFKITVWPFPTQKYYLVQNRSNRHFTLFAYMELNEDAQKVFKKPIGRGYLTPELPEYLQIQMNFPYQKVFIDLKSQKQENKNV